MYDTGRGVPQDYAEAVRWYRRAAEQEHPGAQNNLGLMYDTDRGVPKASSAVAEQAGKGPTCDRLFSLAVTSMKESGEELVKVYKDTKELKELADVLNHGKLGQTKVLLCDMPEVALYRDYAQNEDLGDMMAVVCRFRIDKKDKVLRVCKGTILPASRGTRKVYVVSHRDVEGDELFTYSD